MIEPKPIVSLKDFSWRLGIPLDRLRSIAKDTKAHYTSFSLRKGEKSRTIRPPKPELMNIQRLLNDRIFCHHAPAEAAHGAVKDRSPKTHAEQHMGQRCVVSMDVTGFYPSVRPALIFDTLRSLGFGGEVASLITKLVTRRGELPQGAPTSSVVANLVCKTRVDATMAAAVAERDCKYSRFVDDLSVSGHEPRPLINVAARALSRMGLRIHRAMRRGLPTGKLRIEMRHGAQIVTGLVVNSKRSLSVTRKHRDAVRAAVHAVHTLHQDKSPATSTAKALRSVRGRIAHLDRFHPAVASRFRQRAESLPAHLLRLAKSNRKL